jgi:hypothetical protein
MFASIFVLAAMAVSGAAAQGAPSIQIVLPDPAAAQAVQITGATAAEAAATRAALARLSAGQPVRTVEFGHQGKGRSITATFTARRAKGLKNFWLSKLALDDIGAALTEEGEKVTWVELRGPEGEGTGFEPLTTRALDAKDLRKLAHRIAMRARAQHQPVAAITAYQVAHGAARVVIQLSEEQYLLGTNTRWLDVVPDRFDPNSGYSADVVVLGPGGVRAAEGANFGSTGGVFAYGPTRPGGAEPIAGPVSLRVTLHRTLPEKRDLRFTVDCATATGTCTGFRQEWTLLVPPTVEGSVCSGPYGADTLDVSGTVAGIPVEREYDGCYGRVVLAWEKLLGVPTRR